VQILEVRQTSWCKPLKRLVLKPELDEFLEKMTPAQHAHFKQKVVISLAFEQTCD
jgi:hypothetical protein